MMTVNPFKYAAVAAVRDMSIDGDVMTLTVCFETPDKPVALALFAGDVPISYVRVVCDPAVSSTVADGKSYGRAVISGIRTAYGLNDTPVLQCARSGRTLFTLPVPHDETMSAKPPVRHMSVSDLVLELDPGHLSSIDDLVPYAVEFYKEKGKNCFIDTVYHMFLKRGPAAGFEQKRTFDEKNLPRSLRRFLNDVYDSKEARKFWIRRIPGPASDDFSFRL
ncbi:hypothetical protein [Komagataeibacter oboediens]|uniref:hypothetical protein n=1 Tax=Komagataeibacter oboediens TaxID=65958 RepID=UPI000237DA5D|nr:hypothetical protein [Komagataeibacter oboediens]